MAISLKSNKEVLLSVITDEDGSPVVEFASVNGGRILKQGDDVPAHLDGPIRASVFSLDSYFEQVELAAVSTKMLPLVARRHVDSELVFDESFRLRTRVQTKRERTITTDIVALPEKDIEAAQTLLPLQKQPCLQLVPVEIAIAALVDQVTSSPVMVFWEKGGVLLSLLVAEGVVQSRMRERVRADTRDVVIGRAEASLRSAAGRYGDNKDVFLELYTGDLCDLEHDYQEKAAKQVEDKLARLFKADKDVSKDAVLRSPELFGLPFVSAEWSLLEPNYSQQVQSWRYAMPVAVTAALVGVVFAVVGAFQHLQTWAIASDFDERKAQLSQILSEIDQVRPSDEAMESVRSGLQIQLQSLNEIRLDYMLDWLTHLVPNGVVIRALEVEPKPEPRQNRSKRPVTYPPGEKPFTVKMEVVLPETELDSAEASASEVVRRLSQRFEMLNTRLDVPAPEPGVRRNVVLVVDAQAQAVDF